MRRWWRPVDGGDARHSDLPTTGGLVSRRIEQYEVGTAGGSRHDVLLWPWQINETTRQLSDAATAEAGHWAQGRLNRARW